MRRERERAYYSVFVLCVRACMRAWVRAVLRAFGRYCFLECNGCGHCGAGVPANLTQCSDMQTAVLDKWLNFTGPSSSSASAAAAAAAVAAAAPRPRAWRP